MRMRSLTDKQQRFVDEYLIDLNATQAAIRAGYSKNGAAVTASKLLINTNIKKALSAAKTKRSEITKIDANYVLTRLVEIDQMDALDILTPKGSIKPISEWPKIWRQFISGFDVAEIGGDSLGWIKKIKWPDKVRNLELIGKHVDVQAWKEQRELSGNISIGSILNDLDGSDNGLPGGG